MQFLKTIINFILNLFTFDKPPKTKLELVEDKKKNLEKKLKNIEQEPKTLEDNVDFLNKE